MIGGLLGFVLTVGVDDTWKRYGKFPPPIAPYSSALMSSEQVILPMIFPLVGGNHIGQRFNNDRGDYKHTGVDIIAPKMTPIVAPISGVLGFKTQTFWIYGEDGYKVLGTHLNDDTPGRSDNKANPDFMFAPNLRFGDRVIAGQLIGYVGDSGRASGPHLHFELFTSRGIRNPIFSLQNSQVIQEPRLEIQKKDEAPIR